MVVVYSDHQQQAHQIEGLLHVHICCEEMPCGVMASCKRSAPWSTRNEWEWTCKDAASAASTTVRVAAKSSEKIVSSWKKSQQKRYSAVAVSMSSLLTLLNNTCATSSPCAQKQVREPLSSNCLRGAG